MCCFANVGIAVGTGTDRHRARYGRSGMCCSHRCSQPVQWRCRAYSGWGPVSDNGPLPLTANLTRVQVTTYISRYLYSRAEDLRVKDDLVEFLGFTTRTVKEGEYAGKPAKIVIASANYDTDIEDLWDAITNPRRICRWLGRVTGELELGGCYQIEGNASGRIQECQKPTHLGLTWNYGDQATWVNADLTALQVDRAKLTVEHVVPDDDKWGTFGPGAVGVGWDLALLGLLKHVRDPHVVKLAEGIDRVTSTEGTAFVDGVGNGWREADIASGTASALASKRSDATVRFYTRRGN